MKDLFNLAYQLLTRGDKITTPPDYYGMLKHDAQYLQLNDITICKKGKKFRGEAVSLLTRAISDSPDCKYCYLLRGYVKGTMEPGIREEAIRDCTKSIKIDGSFAEAFLHRAHIKLGGLYCEECDMEGALADMNQCLELAPDHALAYLARASLKKSLRDRQGALADLDKHIEIGLPRSSHFPSWMLFTRGGLKKSLGLYEEAIADFTEVLAGCPKSTDRPYAFTEKAYLLRRFKRYKELVIECDKLLKEEVNFGNDVLEARAKANRLLGNYQEAVRDYDRQILLDPENPEAYRSRGFVRKKLGDFEGKKKDYQLYKKIGMPPF